MVWQAGLPHAGFSVGKPWLPVGIEHAAMAVDTQNGIEASVLTHYRQTLAFRKSHAAMVDGDFKFISTNQDLLAFTRKKGDETLLFVFNLTRKPVEFAIPSKFKTVVPVVLPGFAPVLEGRMVNLEGMDAFCAKV
jgi:alpha-glucosidase